MTRDEHTARTTVHQISTDEARIRDIARAMSKRAAEYRAAGEWRKSTDTENALSRLLESTR